MIGSLFLLAAMTAAPSAAETAAIFTAAGARPRGKDWSLCGEDPRAKARIDLYRDLNGDGLIDVIVVEDSLRCYGQSETSFVLVSKQPNGKFRQMFASEGVAEVLDTRGVGKWPDISIGGPGFCFPVVRWNGREYANQRKQYMGKPCR